MYVYNSFDQVSFVGALCYTIDIDSFYLFYENDCMTDTGISSTEIEFLARLRKCTFDGSIAPEREVKRFKIKKGNILIISMNGDVYFSLSEKYKSKLFRFSKNNQFKESVVPVEDHIIKSLKVQDYIVIKSYQDLGALCDSFKIGRVFDRSKIRYTRPHLLDDGYCLEDEEIDDDIFDSDFAELIF